MIGNLFARCLLFLLPKRIVDRIVENSGEMTVYVLRTSTVRKKQRMTTLVEGVFATLLFDLALFGTSSPLINGLIWLFTTLQNSWDKPFKSKQHAISQVTEFCERLNIQQDPWIWEKKKDEYTSLNDFFSRRYAPNHFPRIGSAAVVSPACCTLSRYANDTELRSILIKGCDYELSKIGLPSEDVPLYNKNDIFIGYLSPTDYHWVHAPIQGTCIYCQMESTDSLSASVKFFGGKFNILNGNRRLIVVIETISSRTKKENLRVAIVIVGGVGVDTIVFDPTMVGKTIEKGQGLSAFRAGGSAVAMFSTKPLDLLPHFEEASREFRSVEVLVGESLADMK